MWTGSWLLAAAWAHPQSFLVRNHSPDDGLPSAQVYAIEQDPLGRMWFATRAGIVLYDGLNWQHQNYLRNEPATHSMHLAADDNGHIWVSSGSSEMLVASFDARRWLDVEAPQHWDLTQRSGLELPGTVGVTGLAVTARESRTLVGVALSTGVLIVGDGERWQNLTTADGLPGESIRDLTAREGTFFMATEHHLCSIDGEVVDCSLGDALGTEWGPLLAIRFAHASRQLSPGGLDRALWILTESRLGRLVDGRAELVATDFKLDWDEQEAAELLVTGNGCIFFGQVQALFHVDQAHGQVTPIGIQNGLASDGCNSLFLDREASLWIGSERGLSTLVSLRFPSYRQMHGLLADEVTAVNQLANGDMVIGHNQGLTFFGTGAPRHIPFDSEGSLRSRPPRVMDLVHDRDDRLWAAASHRGLVRVFPDGTLRWFPIENNGEEDSAFCLLALDDGSILVGGSQGLYRARAGQVSSLEWDRSRFGAVRRLIHGDDGQVLAATSRAGVVIIDAHGARQAPTTAQMASGRTYTLYRDSRRRTWVGTTQGVAVFRDGVVQAPAEGILRFQRPVYLIIEDSHGAMWFGTDDGVLRWDRVALQGYSLHDGFAGRETNRGAAFVDRNHRLWLGSDTGVSVYDPGHDQLPTATLPPTIIGIEVEDRGVQEACSAPLEHDSNTVVFHFATVSSVNPAEMEYRTRLTGFEPGWSEPFSARQRSVRYTNLPPGRYTFNVQARLAGGEWSQPTSADEIRILQPWWRTWWAALLMAAIVSAVIFAASRVVLRWRHATALESEVKLRREAEERYRAILAELEESRANFAAIVEEHVDGILVVDASSVVRFANGAAARLLGTSRFELEGHAFQTPIADGELLELAIKRGGSEEGIGEIRALPTEWQGQIAHILLIRDVTESRQTEDQLRQAQKIEAVGRLAGGVAHDFNNLLQAILSTLEALDLDALADDPGGTLIGELKSHVHQGAALTRRLLQFSRPSSSARSQFDLNLAIHDNLKMLRRLVREDISFVVKLAGESLTVNADRSQVSQVLTNLVVNSCDAMPDGGRLTIATGTEAPDGVWFEVSDTGIGIPEELRNKIFEPFFTTKDRSRGTGLGLSVVHGIVTHHGGHIAVESRTGQGSRFRVTLPAASAESVAEPIRVAESRQRLTAGNGERILVVEDDRTIREGLSKVLSRIGYQVHEAESAEEVGDAAQLPICDLLLTDLILPGQRGDELAHRLRRRWPGLSVVIMSGYSEDETTQLALQVEAASFLYKPFAIEQLTRVIHEALDPEISATRTVVSEAPAASEFEIGETESEARGPRILVVEDHEMLLKLMTRCLEHIGYRTVALRDGHDAFLRIAGGELFDLVITDLDLPGMSGVHLLEHAREIRPDLPFLFCSGNPESLEPFERANGLGTAVLKKPFEVAQLQAEIEGLVSVNKPR